MSKLKKGLITIGLTNLEAEVYLKLSKLKQAKVSELTKVTKVTRTQLYPLLEKLIEKGVIKKIDKKVIVYKIIEPVKLINLLSKWKEDQTTILKEFEKELNKMKKK
jgi:sugar-specific transcriptional regulator TrmB